MITSPSPVPGVATAADRVIANLGPTVGPAMPREFLDTPLANGSLASEFDRAVRVRVERTDGKASLVPETSAARTLLESPAGKRFERLMLGTVNTAALHAAKGVDNLHSITLVPDEHATVAASVMGTYIDYVAGGGVLANGTEQPGEIAEGARTIVADETAQTVPLVSFAAGWNSTGNVIVMPDQSRMLLSTIGAYTPRVGDHFLHAKPKPGDTTPTAQRPLADPYERTWRLMDALDTLVHERHHSVSPANRGKSMSEASNIFEEVGPVLLASRERGHFAQRVGADIETPAWTPEQVKDESNLGWGIWNRDQLPKPPADRVATGQARYTDGPQVARDLLRAAGVDRRTRDGHLIMTQIFQGGDVALTPRRFADIMIDRMGIPGEHREELVTRIREAVQHERGADHVTDWLATVMQHPQA